ncbi:MAG: enoyl-CoA hydratase-related protein [Tissierellia bacterium]|nr:enoyl-CoA hydratase-related protein [Tissierellia bacterium]
MTASVDYKYLIVEQDGAITTVKINKPESLNALNSEVLKELNDCFRRLEDAEETRVIILTGEGRSFVAGADISEMQPLDASQAHSFAKLGMDTFLMIEKHSKPVIAAVNGFALGGGCELALACDIRLASDKALFGQPETGLGITPGFGGTQRLARTIGVGKAKMLIYSAKTIKAPVALDYGLVDGLYPADELMDQANKLAKAIAKNAPRAVSYAKKAIVNGLQADIDTGMDIEKANFALCFATEDQKEGMAAFLNKEEVDYKGK